VVEVAGAELIRMLTAPKLLMLGTTTGLENERRPIDQSIARLLYEMLFRSGVQPTQTPNS